MIPDSLSAVWTAIAPAMANHLWQSTLFAAAAAVLTLVYERIRHGFAIGYGWLPR